MSFMKFHSSTSLGEKTWITEKSTLCDIKMRNNNKNLSFQNQNVAFLLKIVNYRTTLYLNSLLKLFCMQIIIWMENKDWRNSIYLCDKCRNK